MSSVLKLFTAALIILAFALPVSGEQFDLSGGEVQEEDIDAEETSENWVGVSGDTDRFSSGVNDEKIGQLLFDDSQAGTIVENELPGLTGGGYYLAFSPYNEKVEVSNISTLESGDLEKNGLFREEDFPTFYPDYENITDTPDETFTESEFVMLENDHINLSKATLSSGVPLYLAKFQANSTYYPVFIAPIEGNDFNGESYASCYDGNECSHEFILPKYNNTDNLYGINFWSSGQPVQGCSEITHNGSSYVEDGSLSDSNDACLNLTSKNLMVDLLHQTVSGSGSCGIRMKAEENYLRGGEITGFDNAVCTNGAISSEVTDIEVDAGTAVNATDSDLKVRNLDSLADRLIRSDNSSLDTETFKIGSTEIAGMYQNVNVNPAGISQEVEDQTELRPLNLSIEAVETSEGSADNIGFYYPPVNDTGVEPTDILHIKENGSDYTVEELEEVKIDLDGERLIFSEQQVTNFSYFAVFGEKVDKEEVVEEEVVEEEVVEEVVEETVVEETVAPPPPPQESDPQPIMLDLNATSRNVSVRKGEVTEIGFELENYGEVSTGGFFVGADMPEGWTTVSEPVESLNPGESADVTVLLTIEENVEVGSYNRVFQAFRNRSTLDIETVRVDVKPSESDLNLDILSAPTYLRADTGEEKTVGVLTENSGQVNLESVEMDFRNLQDCGDFTTEDYSIDGGQQETFRFDYTASEESNGCTGALVLRNGSKNLAFQPMNIRVSKPADRSSPIILPIILIAWTMVTVYEVLM